MKVFVVSYLLAFLIFPFMRTENHFNEYVLSEANNRDDCNNECKQIFQRHINATVEGCKKNCTRKRGENEEIIKCIQDCGIDKIADCVQNFVSCSHMCDSSVNKILNFRKDRKFNIDKNELMDTQSASLDSLLSLLDFQIGDKRPSWTTSDNPWFFDPSNPRRDIDNKPKPPQISQETDSCEENANPSLATFSFKKSQLQIDLNFLMGEVQ
ncbi:uncharacterized protein MONOS_15357 [Monocercomonoides exilis]|uniref:uncharacterized protein n=1 Tax=Monocercomonoides exilis TaxID=2049356 RepID=UPI00355A71AD|nr:hypothetical protein MONOS_15357 [Monocercomonoides exilis]|eukprot:MONOS_15357.1-p1 / transcript=MONOS_15357.1 / gene=MONOS_15357 / organism=Monocercomonoides_exilis_PA203 / gene_product=unspecified product / transcript_product=unspecified product / location=Mono_scaffold01208:689-1415(-) / protein_length=211 / sequence_SO=supercontig / SO=protein_coding / is_pseudo=false